jgi:hypothetical protein
MPGSSAAAGPDGCDGARASRQPSTEPSPLWEAREPAVRTVA